MNNCHGPASAHPGSCVQWLAGGAGLEMALTMQKASSVRMAPCHCSSISRATYPVASSRLWRARSTARLCRARCSQPLRDGCAQKVWAR